MNRRTLIYILTVFLLSGGLMLSSCGKTKYPTGRDTVKSFGNGRFQILRTATGGKGFHDGIDQATLLSDVSKWKQSGGLIYAFGTRDWLPRYVIVNLETEIVDSFNQFSAIPAGDQDVFRKMGGGTQGQPQNNTGQGEHPTTDY